jgi:hypothetical protein
MKAIKVINKNKVYNFQLMGMSQEKIFRPKTKSKKNKNKKVATFVFSALGKLRQKHEHEF